MSSPEPQLKEARTQPDSMEGIEEPQGGQGDEQPEAIDDDQPRPGHALMDVVRRPLLSPLARFC